MVVRPDQRWRVNSASENVSCFGRTGYHMHSGLTTDTPSTYSRLHRRTIIPICGNYSSRLPLRCTLFEANPLQVALFLQPQDFFSWGWGTQAQDRRDDLPDRCARIHLKCGAASQQRLNRLYVCAESERARPDACRTGSWSAGPHGSSAAEPARSAARYMIELRIKSALIRLAAADKQHVRVLGRQEGPDALFAPIQSGSSPAPDCSTSAAFTHSHHSSLSVSTAL